MNQPLVSSGTAWTPHPYQKKAIKLLLSQACVGLLLDPGLGKSSISLAGIMILKQQGLLKKTLIVAPIRPMQKTWPDEIKKWTDFQGLSYTILHGKKKEENLKLNVDIYLINPEGLEWLLKHPHGGAGLFDLLIVDESTKFKNSQTKRFKTLKNFLGLFARRWILTGTPTPNGLMDLFGQIYILDLGRALGRYITHYRTEFFNQSGFGGYEWTLKEGSYDKIIQRIAPLCLRLQAEDHLQMPDLIKVTIPVTLPPAVMKIYKEIEEEFISGDIVAANGASAGVKCRQVANGAVYLEDLSYRVIHDSKLDALSDLLEEIGAQPVLLLYEFNHDKERILKRLPGAEVLGGSLSQARANSIIDRFNAGKLPILLGHPASMGHGVNLQGAARHVVWFGIPWDYDLYDQAIRRIYRQGQKATSVLVYHISAVDTLDQRVTEVLVKKEGDNRQIGQAISAYRQANIEAA